MWRRDDLYFKVTTYMTRRHVGVAVRSPAWSDLVTSDSYFLEYFISRGVRR